jgi:hypothetical protein
MDSFTCYILRLPQPPRYKAVLTGIGEDLPLAWRYIFRSGGCE